MERVATFWTLVAFSILASAWLLIKSHAFTGSLDALCSDNLNATTARR
jgi:hypothetical protein